MMLHLYDLRSEVRQANYFVLSCPFFLPYGTIFTILILSSIEHFHTKPTHESQQWKNKLHHRFSKVYGVTFSHELYCVLLLLACYKENQFNTLFKYFFFHSVDLTFEDVILVKQAIVSSKIAYGECHFSQFLQFLYRFQVITSMHRKWCFAES